MSFEKAFLYFLGLAAGLICVFPKMVVPAIAGILLFVIIGYMRKKIVFQYSIPAILLIVLYLVYFVGTFFTHHRDLANHYIESKLSFVIFPLLLSFRFKQKINLQPVAIGLAAGIVVTSIMGFGHSIHRYQFDHDVLASFTASNFSWVHHPTYFSAFILLSAALIIMGYLRRWSGFRLWWIVPLLGYYLAIYILCLSLAAMLFLFMLGIVLGIRFTWKRFGKRGLLTSVIIIPVLGISCFLTVPRMQYQFNDASGFFFAYIHNPEKFILTKLKNREGSEVRLIMWTVSAQEFSEHPWGVGTGNVDDYLTERLRYYKQEEMIKKEFNPHNQYLQTALEIGTTGLAVFLLLIGFTIRFAWKHRNYLLLILVTGLAFNCLFESMLQRQSGIVFYSFWICLLIMCLNSHNSLNEKSGNERT